LSDFPFSAVAEDILQRNAQVIVETLKAFNIESEVSCWEIGPRVTRFELRIAPGINVSRLHALADNLALELAVPAVRLETPIPGKSAVGIEVPNRKFNKIALRSLLESPELKSKAHPLAIPIGRDIAGKPVIGNIHDMHHLLVAGSTGSGKSVCLNAILVSLMYRNSPASLRLILIDPKRVEMSVFKDTPHLAAPIVHDINEALSALKWVVAEMESRLRAFEVHGVRNIDGYNDNPPESGPLPYILVVVDELADLIKAAGPVFERLIGRIAHLARATGIHLIVATQRPDAKIITGNIKMNIPSRIAFAVVSQIDSRTIIDMPGAEKLLGSGDMLYFPVGIPKPLRVQGAMVRDEEVKRVAEFLRKQTKPDYIEDITAFAGENGGEDWDSSGNGGGGGNELDELYGDAMDIITRAGRASTSLLQRRLKIGYNRAARIMEQMEQQGVVSPADHQGNRELLIAPQPKDDEDY
jgi:S-DNA-T family DNA segregation ATPase FtsK/SpoIIIE